MTVVLCPPEPLCALQPRSSYPSVLAKLRLCRQALLLSGRLAHRTRALLRAADPVPQHSRGPALGPNPQVLTTFLDWHGFPR